MFSGQASWLGFFVLGALVAGAMASRIRRGKQGDGSELPTDQIANIFLDKEDGEE